MGEQIKRLLTLQEAAEILVASERHVRNLLKSGKLKAYNIAIPGSKIRELRFDPYFVEQLVDET